MQSHKFPQVGIKVKTKNKHRLLNIRNYILHNNFLSIKYTQI